MSFQDGRHSILSLVCLAFLCSVFKVRYQMLDARLQMSDLLTLKSHLSSVQDQILNLNKHSCLLKFKTQSVCFPASVICRLMSNLVGSRGLEPPTSRLSGVRSNHLSYEPVFKPVRHLCFPSSLQCLPTPCWWR